MPSRTLVTRGRGRPREFDPERALKRASELFRKQGYAATSLEQLTEAMGISKPSLYSAYGDKAELYLHALDAFAHRTGEAARKALEGSSRLEEALQGFYSAVLDIYFAGKGSSRGCLVMATAVAEAQNQPRVKKRLAEALHGADSALEMRLRREAHVPVGAPAPAELAAWAQIATGVMVSLGTRARAGTPRPVLDEIAAATSALIADALRRR